MLDLILPLECGGCGAPSTRWCVHCAAQLTLRPDHPWLITPRVDPGVPVWSLGRYAGARRQAIVAAKEHGRRDLIWPLSAALSAGLHRMLDWGVVAAPLTVVPAPTRRLAARRRGGDPITRIAVAAGAAVGAVPAAGYHPGVRVVAALRTRALVRDSVGQSTAARQRNIVGRVRLRTGVDGFEDGDVLVVDDIVTTGTTATESVRVLRRAGARVTGVLVIAHA